MSLIAFFDRDLEKNLSGTPIALSLYDLKSETKRWIKKGNVKGKNKGKFNVFNLAPFIHYFHFSLGL